MATHKQALKVVLNPRMFLFWAIITGTVFVAHYFSDWLEKMVVSGDSYAWIYLFLWYFAWLGIVGSTLSYLFMRGGR